MGAQGHKPLVHPSQTAAVIQRFGFRFSRDLGQNFLVDANVLRKIVGTADLSSEDVVLEIGPGIGTLTEALAERADLVVAVEVDKKLLPVLEETLSRFDNVEVVARDAMDLGEQDALVGGRAANKLVANLPYNVAAPVILKLFSEFPAIETMVVMVQREIGDRITAKPGSKNYSAFTVKLRYFCRAKSVMIVSRRVFMPPPNVDSAVLKLTRWEKPPVAVEKEKLFALITAAFSQRRKQLVNALAGAPGWKKEDIAEALAGMGLPANARAEELGLEDFAKLCRELN